MGGERHSRVAGYHGRRMSRGDARFQIDIAEHRPARLVRSAYLRPPVAMRSVTHGLRSVSRRAAQRIYWQLSGRLQPRYRRRRPVGIQVASALVLETLRLLSHKVFIEFGIGVDFRQRTSSSSLTEPRPSEADMLIHRCDRGCMPQSSSKASQGARKATQPHHHRNRTKAGHNRQRDDQDQHLLPVSAQWLDTGASHRRVSGYPAHAAKGAAGNRPVGQLLPCSDLKPECVRDYGQGG